MIDLQTPRSAEQNLMSTVSSDVSSYVTVTERRA